MPTPTRSHAVVRKTHGNDDKAQETPPNIGSDEEFDEVSINPNRAHTMARKTHINEDNVYDALGNRESEEEFEEVSVNSDTVQDQNDTDIAYASLRELEKE